MTTYVSGGLPVDIRRRIARYIDECPDCDAEYRRVRELSRELAALVPALGLPEKPQVNRIWGQIQQELTAPLPRRRMFSSRYGLGMLLLALLLIVPFVYPNSYSAAVPSQPPPVELSLHKTPVASRTVASTSLIRSTDSSSEILLQNTPEPGSEPVGY